MKTKNIFISTNSFFVIKRVVEILIRFCEYNQITSNESAECIHYIAESIPYELVIYFQYLIKVAIKIDVIGKLTMRI